MACDSSFPDWVMGQFSVFVVSLDVDLECVVC